MTVKELIEYLNEIHPRYHDCDILLDGYEYNLTILKKENIRLTTYQESQTEHGESDNVGNSTFRYIGGKKGREYEEPGDKCGLLLSRWEREKS